MGANLTQFTQWYEQNQKELLAQAEQDKEKNKRLGAKFLIDWPLERLKSLALDEYVTGKGPQNKSFCYEIESGKYRDLYLGIRGGTAGKFGIYWSKKYHAYCDQNNQVIAENELNQQFSRLKADLVAIVTKGLNADFSDPVFQSRQSTNSFFGRSAMVTKLLCAYSTTPVFSGINLNKDQKTVWGPMLSLEAQGGVYKQNYELTRLISEKYPQLDGALLSSLLWWYRNASLDVNAQENEVVNLKAKTDFKNKYTSALLTSKNIIFHGAPGTGKSYLAKEIATDIISAGQFTDYTQLTAEQKQQIEFVQFHPSYDYTDFVEGLRPRTNADGSMGFELQDGIFKKFVGRAQKNLINSKKSKSAIEKEVSVQEMITDYFANIELGVDELTTTRGTKFYITDADENHINVSIPENAIADKLSLSVDTIKQMLTSGRKFKQVTDITRFFGKLNGTQSYSYDLAIFKAIKATQTSLAKPTVQPEKLKPYIFIIDEINRGEIAKIFGELFFSIDPGYRGPAGEVTTQYASLHDDHEEKFFIPENVYIVGTMNDIDRSVDTFDFAMRRRFRFIEIKAGERIGMLDSLENAAEAKQRMNTLNNAIAMVEELNENYQIGAAYFLKLKTLTFDQLWTDYLEPLLQDYIHGMQDETKIMVRLAQAYDYSKVGSTDHGIEN